MLRRRATPTLLILAGALVMLLPAYLSGRPFVFYDTWEFYMWGRDVLAAFSNPWPHAGPFPVGRELWASDVVASPPAIVDERLFRLILSTKGSRSAFYAVPLYLATFMWVAAAVQALIVSATLYVVVRATGWKNQPVAFMTAVIFLTTSTTMPFFAAFMMPDIFTPLCALASGLLIFYRDRLSVAARCGLSMLVVYAVAVHTSNLPLMIVAVVTGFLLNRLRSSTRDSYRAVTPIGGLLVAGLAVLVTGNFALRTVFGRPALNPPFILGRVIADGPGAAYLRDACRQPVYVSCELVPPESRFELYQESFMWPFVGEVPFSPRVDPDRREAFYAEAWPIVLGTLRRDPLGQVRASLRNAFHQLTMFKIRLEMDYALPETLRLPWRRAAITAAITPNVEVCQAGDGSNCNQLLRGRQWRMLQLWQHFVVACAGLLVLYRVVPVFARRAWSSFGRDRLFAMFTLCLVVANGVICGILSGPYHRYQARIVWLVPVAALVVEGGCGWLTGRFAERPVRSVSTAPTRSPTGAACAPESGRRRPAAAS